MIGELFSSLKALLTTARPRGIVSHVNVIPLNPGDRAAAQRVNLYGTRGLREDMKALCCGVNVTQRQQAGGSAANPECLWEMCQWGVDGKGVRTMQMTGRQREDVLWAYWGEWRMLEDTKDNSRTAETEFVLLLKQTQSWEQLHQCVSLKTVDLILCIKAHLKLWQ